MKFLHTALAAVLACFATLAQASSLTTDFSDLWFNANESGWGANVIQQNDTLFVTLFVYGPQSQPTWYVASAVRFTGSSGGTLNFSGPLYQTSGPYFGGSFNPNNVTVRQVGTLTFSASQISAAQISYGVDGVNINKSVVRQNWANENLAGVYLGSSLGTWTNCGAARNGYLESYAMFTITHDASNAVTIREDGSNYTCNYSGNYTQAGRMGTIIGTGLCSDGVNATFTATEVQVSLQSIAMRFLTNQINGSCTFVGREGGVRRGP